MTDKMWALSSGSYSDYRVLCVCPSKKVAKQLAARYNADNRSYDEVYVEQIAFVSDPDIQRIEIMSMFQEIWDNGEISEPRQQYRVEWPFDLLYPEAAVPVSVRWVRAPIHHNKGGRLEVHGTDHERVRKTFSEMSAALRTDDALRAKGEFRR